MDPCRSDPLITLTTDFGEKDWFVGVMKGAILQRCPSARLVDITHGIGRHDVREGALALMAALPYFPEGAIHLVVVDPGVGSARRGLAVKAEGALFVAPDNGVLSYALRGVHPAIAVSLRERGRTASHTFHGRDLFGPAAGDLAAGAPIESLGPIAKDPLLWPFPKPRQVGPGRWVGEILHVDTFGNLITSFGLETRDLLDASKGKTPLWSFSSASFAGMASTYADVALGDVVVYWGSLDLVEVAVREGDASKIVGLKRGDPVTLQL